MSQHVVNIAFDFDDDKVRKILEDSAEQQVIADIKSDIYNQLGKKRYGYGNYTKEEILNNLASKGIDSFLEDYKDEILNLAATKLADRLIRTKAVREMTKEVLESAT